MADIAAYTGLPEGVVRRVVTNSPALRWEVGLGEPCKRCGGRSAQPGSDYCALCRHEVSGLLDEAIHRLRAAKAAAEERGRRMTVTIAA